MIELIRHPAAFVSSVKRLGWTHDFALFLDQPLLLRDHLAPFEAEIRDFAEHERDQIDQAILLWRLIYHTVGTFRDRHPEWTFVRHEDLSREPVAGFESLFDTLGVEIDDGIRRTIEGHSGAGNPTELREKHDVRLDSAASIESWRRRLEPAEIERIRTGVADVAPAFYLRGGLVVGRCAVGQCMQHLRESAPLAVEVDERRQHTFEARLLDDSPAVLPDGDDAEDLLVVEHAGREPARSATRTCGAGARSAPAPSGPRHPRPAAPCGTRSSRPRAHLRRRP